MVLTDLAIVPGVFIKTIPLFALVGREMSIAQEEQLLN